MYGAVAGAVSKILVYPLDTGKKLLQVYRLSPQKASIAVFLKQHFQATGVRGLYAGVVTATLKSALSSSLLFGFFRVVEAVVASFSGVGCLFVTSQYSLTHRFLICS